MRMRLKLHKEEHREGEMYLKIYSNMMILYNFLFNIKHLCFFYTDILSRNFDGAENIANRKCLRIEFYKIIHNQENIKDDLANIVATSTGQ